MANIARAAALLHSKASHDVLPVHDLNLPRGAITEIVGSRSSGRAALTHAILAASISMGETCAIIDAADSFDPTPAAANGVLLDRIFWVRCRGRADHAIKAADWILHAGGFGVAVLDLCEIAPEVLRRIPLSSWYHYRNAIENTRTVFVVVADLHVTGSCAARNFSTDRARTIWSSSLLEGLEMTLVSRKPAAVKPARYEARLVG